MTMPDLWTLASAPTVDLLGWTLLHVVWQGALLAALLAGALRLLRHHTPRVRYAVSCAALLGLLALPVGTALFLSETGAPVENAPASAVVSVPAESPALDQSPDPESVAEEELSWQEQVAAWAQPVLPWLVFGWGLGVLVFAGRLAGGAWRVRRLRRQSRSAPSEWQTRLQALAEQMGLRRSVALRRSERVESPMVAGWWRPVVLVPAGLLSGLPPAQVEALLLHELAHVRRHDVLVGRLQAIVETLLFFHPATWWISGQVRQTREACCDDLAVRAGAARTVYARALTTLAERAGAGSTAAWAPAAGDGSLLSRIQRLLAPTEAPSKHTQRLSLAAAVLLLVGVPLGLAACASQQSTTETDASVEVDSLRDGALAVQRGGEVDTIDYPRPWVELRDDGIVQHHRDGTVDTIQTERLDDGRLVLQRGEVSDTISHSHVRFGRLEGGGHVVYNDKDGGASPPSKLEHLDDGTLVVRRDGRVDTLDYPLLFRVSDSDRPRRRNLNSLRHQRADSLARRHREHADSLRRHIEQVRTRTEREMPDRLREQARRLREQAERLEKRAEEMETPASPMSPPDPEQNPTTGTEGEGTSRFFLKDLQVTVDGATVIDGDVSLLRGDGYVWVRGPSAVYAFSARPFDQGQRVGTFQGSTLSATIEGHQITVHSSAQRAIYVREGAAVYADRVPLKEIGTDVGLAGVGPHLAAIDRDLRRFGK